MTAAPPRATAREWIGVAALVLPALLASMDLSVLFIAIPWISADLAPTATQQLWVMDIYGFVMAGLLITMGAIGDRIGRRKLLLIGAVAFGAASVVAALSTSAEMLIGARALLGFGAATLAPSTLSLIRGMFVDEAQRRTAIGIWTAAFTGGIAIGPIIGGLLLEHFHWGSVFLINVPVMVLLLVAAPLLVRESRDPHPGSFDLLGAALSLAAVLPTIYGIKKIVEDGFGGFYLGCIATGVAFACLFLLRQRNASTPMIDVGLFRRASFSASIIANSTVVFGSAGMGLMAVTFIQIVLGYGPFDAALWMLPTVGGSLAGVVAASIFGRFIRPAFLIAAGLVTCASGFFWVSTIEPNSHIGVLIAGYALLTAGVGMTSTMATSLVLTTAPPEKAGTASAISETSLEFGGALGIATLGTVAAAVYSSQLQGKVPEGVGEGRVEAAQDTINGAVAVAEHVAPEFAGPLLTEAFAAYTQGFNTAAVAAGFLIVGVGVLAAIALRNVTSQQSAEDEAEERQLTPQTSGLPR
ncbi:MAG TPA: MFS transporter [Jiangellaceae bacterium]|nr:MFS transporter [Jiangellaceae bacterium]